MYAASHFYIFSASPNYGYDVNSIFEDITIFLTRLTNLELREIVQQQLEY